MKVQEVRSIAPGMRVLVRGQEWLVAGVDRNSLDNVVYRCTGISPLVAGSEAVFLSDLDTVELLDPAKTMLVLDESPHYRDARLAIESALRRAIPTDEKLHIGHRGAMDLLPYQLEPAALALGKPRQRILIADAVGLGKTLEAGVLMSELIARGKGKRILVVTTKSMMRQFQMEMWNRFSIPLVSLDSQKIKAARAKLPANANPFFHFDRAIVSVDTIKNSVEYSVHLENAYWDIIVIDEAQNVAERGHSSAQRSKLAKKLATRSDALIMLSATPHDGRPKSFASLMNMLDPTAIADSENYSPQEIEGLFVRRFKKDVRGDLRGAFAEREVSLVRARASAAEEHVFDVFSGLDPALFGSAKGAGDLFLVSLEKALFSSPAAALASVGQRIRRVESKGDARGELVHLKRLKAALESVGVGGFSRYQELLVLLRSLEYGWNRDDSSDRIVVFTERIATMEFLAARLARDLELADAEIATISGAMSDVEQQKIVQDFGSVSSKVRVLVASDVASEGLNLHHHCHRLIHFDTPWSLMVFQQRNGRVDRYGQAATPDIRFLLTECANERIRGDVRILEILIEKEQQAYENIGDPAMLMGKFSVDDETRMVEEAIAGRLALEAFEASLADPGGGSSAGGTRSGGPVNLMELLLGEASTASVPSRGEGPGIAGFGAAGSASMGSGAAQTPNGAAMTVEETTLLSDLDYLVEGLEAFRSDGIDTWSPLEEAEGIRLNLNPAGALSRYLQRRVPEADFAREAIVLSPDRFFCEREAVRARSSEAELGHWPQAQFLWRLHPVLDWVADTASMRLFGREQAPVVEVPALGGGEVLILGEVLFANRNAAPVVDMWKALRYRGGQFVEALSVDELREATHISDVRLPNRARTLGVAFDYALEAAQRLVPDAVQALAGLGEQACSEYQRHAQEKIRSEQEKLHGLRAKHEEHLELEALSARRKETRLDEIAERFAATEAWARNAVEVQGGANVRIHAVFVGVAE